MSYSAQVPSCLAPPRLHGMSCAALEEIPGDIFVFINRPFETLSHAFFEEMAAQAMREDCRAVTGIYLDPTGRILHSASKIVDTFAGINFREIDLLRDILVVRSVEALSSEFFACKRARLEALGGLAAISSASMPELARRLVDLPRPAISTYFFRKIRSRTLLSPSATWLLRGFARLRLRQIGYAAKWPLCGKRFES